MSKYTQRQWDRTVGHGKVPDEYNIEIENLKHENKLLRKMIHSLSRDTKEQVDKFIAVAVAVEKIEKDDYKDGLTSDEREEYFHKYVVCDWEA
tara:strand:- start:3605 stop:3883 length:279 start_codon:yes stop_codon:yes gene_type:complete